MPGRRTSLASKGATAFSPKATGHPPSSFREVFTRGVPFGTVHLVGMQGSTTEERTLCGNWPGREPAPEAQQPRCPVCWRGRE